MKEYENLEKLTDLLYNNGIAKAQQEAERLKSQAEMEAKQIVQEAEKQARELIESAKRESAELMKSTESELQLKARRVIHDTRAAIENQLLKEVVEKPLSQTLSSPDFYKEIILELARSSEFSKGKVWLPQAQEAGLSEFLDSQIAQEMQDIECHFAPDISKGFKIKLSGKKYYFSFEEMDFINYFHQQLTERTKEILFNQ